MSSEATCPITLTVAGDPRLARLVRMTAANVGALCSMSVDRIEDIRMAAEAAAKQAMEHGMKKVSVFVKGPGSGRETAIRSLQAAGLEVSSIQDKTPIPHNGCRPKKRRRV